MLLLLWYSNREFTDNEQRAMPPKKRVKKQAGVRAMSADDKYRKTVQEVEVLKDHLALRKQIARRSVEASEEWKERMKKAEQELESQASLHRAVSADLTRQFRIKNSEQEQNINKLDSQLRKSQQDLQYTSAELQRVNTMSDVMIRERNTELEALNLRISSLSSQCHTLINEQLDKLEVKISDLSTKWDEKSDKVFNEVNSLLRSYGYSTVALQ